MFIESFKIVFVLFSVTSLLYIIICILNFGIFGNLSLTTMLILEFFPLCLSCSKYDTNSIIGLNMGFQCLSSCEIHFYLYFT